MTKVRTAFLPRHLSLEIAKPAMLLKISPSTTVVSVTKSELKTNSAAGTRLKTPA